MGLILENISSLEIYAIEGQGDKVLCVHMPHSAAQWYNQTIITHITDIGLNLPVMNHMYSRESLITCVHVSHSVAQWKSQTIINHTTDNLLRRSLLIGLLLILG